MFRQRCLYWGGILCAIAYLLKIIWFNGVFLFQQMTCVWLVVMSQKQLLTFFCIVIFLEPFGLMCGLSWEFIWSLLVSFDTILFSLPGCQVCQELPIFSLQLSGLLLFGWFGRNEIIACSKTRQLLHLPLLKKLRCIHSYGWNQTRQHQLILIMIGGNIRFLVWICSCNFVYWLAL